MNYSSVADVNEMSVEDVITRVQRSVCVCVCLVCVCLVGPSSGPHWSSAKAGVG